MSVKSIAAASAALICLTVLATEPAAAAPRGSFARSPRITVMTDPRVPFGHHSPRIQMMNNCQVRTQVIRDSRGYTIFCPGWKN
jgi:hypothetical protein